MSKDGDVFKPREGDKLLLFSINQGIKERPDPYDAARYAWHVDPKKAEDATLILACVRGVVKGVYVPVSWLPASPGKETQENFHDLLKKYPRFKPTPAKSQKYGFRGEEADETSQKHYEDKRVPKHLKIGALGFRYSY